MFKKIALFCLLSTPLIGSEKPNPQSLIPTTITDSLKKLDEKIDQIMLDKKLSDNSIQQKIHSHHQETIGILRVRLPHLPRTKIFLTGALAGFGACLYLQRNNPELFTYPQFAISRLEQAFAPIPKTTAITTQLILPADGTAPDESGAQEAAEQQAAKDSKSCYFK